MVDLVGGEIADRPVDHTGDPSLRCQQVARVEVLMHGIDAGQLRGVLVADPSDLAFEYCDAAAEAAQRLVQALAGPSPRR